MSDIRRLLRRAYGRLDPGLRAVLAGDVDARVDELLACAAARWKAASWHRFDDKEANCTVQLYRWLADAVRTCPEFVIFDVQLEWVQPTPEMLEGISDATSASRPDLRVRLGSAGRTIECKRLGPTGSLPKKYVHAGMARFVTMTYAANETTGRMVGYVQTGEAAIIAAAVNSHVVSHPDMGLSHQLQQSAGVSGFQSSYRSTHTRAGADPIALLHYWVDLQTP